MRRRRRDSGFALLLVFLMAAVFAITLYMEMPRVAFDSQRQKEQLLIERGEQYKVAIRRFLQANPNRWPGSMDELESFNNRRFLRHRYKDPMTGKDEWRLIHIQNGVLTDSKNNKPKGTDQAKNANPNTFIQEQAGLGSVGAPGSQSQAAWKNRRPSDDQAGTMPGGAPAGPTDPNDPNAPAQPGAPGSTIPGQPGYPGSSTPGVGVVPPGLPTAPGMSNTGGPAGSGWIVNQPGLGSIGTGGSPTAPNGQPVYPGQQQYPGAPGMPVNSQTGGVSPYPTLPGQQGANPGQQSQAIGMINNLLTSPRPGGMAGIQGGPGLGQPGGMVTTGQFGGNMQAQGLGQGAAGGFGSTPGSPIGTPLGAGGQTMGGGIAGVASTLDADSIMEYGEHTNYSEWEFVFDPTKWHAPPNPNVGTIGTSAAQLGTSPNNLNTGIAGSGASATTGFNSGASSFGGAGGTGGPGGPGGQTQGGGQMPGGQMGTGGMGGASQFGGGGLPDIRPGRR